MKWDMLLCVLRILPKKFSEEKNGGKIKIGHSPWKLLATQRTSFKEKEMHFFNCWIFSRIPLDQPDITTLWCNHHEWTQPTISLGTILLERWRNPVIREYTFKKSLQSCNSNSFKNQDQHLHGCPVSNILRLIVVTYVRILAKITSIYFEHCLIHEIRLNNI